MEYFIGAEKNNNKKNVTAIFSVLFRVVVLHLVLSLHFILLSFHFIFAMNLIDQKWYIPWMCVRVCVQRV